MVNLLFLPDGEVLTTKGIVKTLYDPACAPAGCSRSLRSMSASSTPDARLEVFGQGLQRPAYAICGSDMMIKGQEIEHNRFRQ